MAKKFNFVEEAKKVGFEESTDRYGFRILVKDFTSMQIGDLLQGRGIHVEINVNPDETVVCAHYYYCGSKRSFKDKTHLAEKRAYNAIKATIEYAGYVFM